jgi:hypothetical protein
VNEGGQAINRKREERWRWRRRANSLERAVRHELEQE